MQEEKKIVKNFNNQMYAKIKLRHNRYAPLGWKTMDVKRVMTLLEGELAELKEALQTNDKEHIRDEAIDVANYCMFIHELHNESK